MTKLNSGMNLGELLRLALLKLHENRKILLDNPQLSDLFNSAQSLPSSLLAELSNSAEAKATKNRLLEVLQLAEISEFDYNTICAISTAICRRSASLAGAAAAVLSNRIRHKHVYIGVDGSVYSSSPAYQAWMQEVCIKFVKDRKLVEFFATNDGSGMGAALTAAITDDL